LSLVRELGRNHILRHKKHRSLGQGEEKLGGKARISRWMIRTLEAAEEEVEEEEEEEVSARENRGGSAQHATRATPILSSHGPMRA